MIKKLFLLTIVLTATALTYTKHCKQVKEQAPATQRTFAIIKPHAVKEHLSGPIINVIELNKFTIARMEKKQLTRKEAETFYAVHKDRPFFKGLIESMIADPVIILALEKENAIQDWRTLMGSTNPEQSPVGTLRRMYGTDTGHNAVHGSDAVETAQKELAFFFPSL